MAEAAVRCILVNYRTPWEMLQRCLDSIYSYSGKTGCEVTVVDNGSRDGSLARLADAFPEAKLISLPANLGFAAGVNEGLASAGEPYVLLLNTDAVLAPGALDAMVEALQEAPAEVAGVAPKMLSSTHEGIIDAVGTVMPPTGAGFNRGIGQCDLGQYDRREEVAGVCFGAALLRRELFEPEAVGLLYEGYFLYFEDSDWCLRAVSQGYRFITAPQAAVYHMHSGVTRQESLPFKYRLIELNTLKLVVRNFESARLAAGIVAARCARLVARTIIRRRFIGPNLSVLLKFAICLPDLLVERRRLRRRRVITDRRVFAMAAGEDAYFDTVEYRPDRALDSLIDTYERIVKEGRGDGQARPAPKLLDALSYLKQSGKAPDGAVRDLFAGEPACVRMLLEEVR